MAKFKPGIPDSFTFDVTPVSDLGDYLDEPSPMPQRKPRSDVADPEEGREAPVVREAVTAAPVQQPVTAPPQVTAPVTSEFIRPAISSTPSHSAAQQPAPVARPIELREERVI